MNPDTCDDVEDAGDESPADWPRFKPGRPYGVYPTPPGLVRPPLRRRPRPPARKTGNDDK